MPRRILEGNVVSDKANKTVTVLVERRFKHPVYKKIVKMSDKYTAHDETNSCKEGDRVQIIECRPISKTKSWVVLKDGAAAMPLYGKEAKAAAKPAEKKAAAPTKAKKVAAPKKEAVKKDAPAKKDVPGKEAAKKPAAKKKTTAKKDA
jgi:small subunit ribosomal protein S17